MERFSNVFVRRKFAHHLAGWPRVRLACRENVTGWGFGLIGDIAVGIVGALIGSWLLPRLGVHVATGILSQIVVATLGAILLLLVIGLIRGGFPRRRWRF